MSRLTREDFDRLQELRAHQEMPLSIKEAERQQLERQTAEFLARGGCIKRIEFDVTVITEPPVTVFNTSLATKRAAKRNKDSVGVTVAAEMLGISRTLLSKQCKKGMGPRHHFIDRKLRFLVVDVEAYKIKLAEKVAA